MKKTLFILGTLVFSMALFLSIPTESKASIDTPDITNVENILKNTQISLDINNPFETETKKVITDENNNVLGTLGIEKEENLLLPLERAAIGKNEIVTFKVYWYTVLANYSFRVTVKLDSNGKGVIVDAYDPWYLIIPPGKLSSDVLSIENKYETSLRAAEARYTLKISSPVSTSMYIYGKVQNGQFISGGN